MATTPPKVVQFSGAVVAENKREEAPTIYADAIQGVMVSETSVKISFVENFVFPESDGTTIPKGRYVLNLVMPAPQLQAMGDLFIRVAGESKQMLATNAVAPQPK